MVCIFHKPILNFYGMYFYITYFFLSISYFLISFFKMGIDKTQLYDKDQLCVDTIVAFTTHRFDIWEVVVTYAMDVRIRNKVIVTITRSDTITKNKWRSDKLILSYFWEGWDDSIHNFFDDLWELEYSLSTFFIFLLPFPLLQN